MKWKFVAVVVAGGALSLGWLWWRSRSRSKARPSVAPPAPSSKPTPDAEECYDHEMKLVVDSLPQDEAREFGRLYDAIGSLIVSCPSDEGSRRLSDTMMIGIFCRNRLWGLSSLVEYAHALPGLYWAQNEMLSVVEQFGPNKEWKKSAEAVVSEYFQVLQKSQFQLRNAN